jgi:hypothetical protein
MTGVKQSCRPKTICQSLALSILRSIKPLTETKRELSAMIGTANRCGNPDFILMFAKADALFRKHQNEIRIPVVVRSVPLRWPLCSMASGIVAVIWGMTGAEV